jgi:CRP-like cAMP-binding protein
MLILRYLAKGANDAGRHYVSRATMSADCGLSFDTFNRTLKYLKSLGILSWKKGFGNQYSDVNVANTYQLHLRLCND